MAGSKLRKTKKGRIGPGIDERIEARFNKQELSPTSTQWGISGVINNPGAGGDGQPDPPGSALITRDKKTAAASGGTAVFTLDLAANFPTAFCNYDCRRTGYAEAGGFDVLTLSTNIVLINRRAGGYPDATSPEFTIGVSLSSGSITVTFTNNHASQDLDVNLIYKYAEAI